MHKKKAKVTWALWSMALLVVVLLVIGAAWWMLPLGGFPGFCDISFKTLGLGLIQKHG